MEEFEVPMFAKSRIQFHLPDEVKLANVRMTLSLALHLLRPRNRISTSLEVVQPFKNPLKGETVLVPDIFRSSENEGKQ